MIGIAAADDRDERLAEGGAADVRCQQAVQERANERQDDDQGEQVPHRLSFQVRERVRFQRALPAHEEQHDGDGDGDLRRGDDEDQEHEHRAGRRARLLRERDEARG